MIAETSMKQAPTMWAIESDVPSLESERVASL